MRTLQIEKAAAIQAYSNGTAKEKSLLEKLFGKAAFSLSVLERIKTLEDACNDQGINYTTLFDGMTDEYKKAELAIETFAKSLREDKPLSECIYYPYFTRAAGGFSYCDCGYGVTATRVGARLRVDTAAKAEHLGRCMTSYYRTYLTGA